MTDTSTENTPNSWPARLQNYKAMVVIATVVLGINLAGLWWLSRQAEPLAPVSSVTLALPTQINSAPAIVAFSQGLFSKAGVTVVNQPFELGKDALKSVLDGQADLAVVADTPFMNSVLAGNDIAALAAISQARRVLAIVARSDQGINSVKDLAGKSVALTIGTNMPYFLDSMLQVNGVPSDKVSLQDMKVDATLSAVQDGKVAGAVVFQPFLAQLQQSMGSTIKIFYGEDVYAFRFLLVGKPAYIDSHPQEIQRVLSALIAASAFIKATPIEARQAVGQAVKVDDALMAKFFDPEDYEVVLDQALLLALDDQTRWAMKRGITKATVVPNYLSVMKYQNLEAVMPAAVKLIH